MAPLTRNQMKKITALRGPPVRAVSLDAPPRGFPSLFNDTTFSDATVICGGKMYHIHRNIVSAFSPYFHSAFTNQWLEASTRVISIDELDIKPIYVEWVLKFIYDGNLIFLSDLILDNLTIHHTCVELFIAADYFQVDSLMQETVRLLKEYNKEMAANHKKTNWFGNKNEFLAAAAEVYAYQSATFYPLREIFRDFVKKTSFTLLQDKQAMGVVHGMEEFARDILMDLAQFLNDMPDED